MLFNILLVGVGGFTGSVMRYLIAWATADYSRFPIGTFLVNVLGCFAVGLIVGMAERHDWAPGTRLFLAVGFCGGFTTFSSFAMENILLLQSREIGAFALNSGLSFVVGLAAVLAGLYIARN